MKKIYLLTITLVFLLAAAHPALATTYYVDAGRSSDGGDGRSWSTAKKYISSGIGLMNGGDILYVRSGTYTSSNDRIDNVPSGSSGSYTRIYAENDWGVTLDVPHSDYNPPVDIHDNSYIEIRGFICDGGWSPMVYVNNAHHIKILRCGITYGGMLNSNSDDCLYEQCFAYGDSRYSFQVNKGSGFSERIVFKECIVRWDGANMTEPLACFANYDQKDIYYFNCMAIDGIEVHNDSGYTYRGMCGFKTPNGGENTRYYGCIVLNLEGPGYFFEEGPVSGHVLNNCIAWDIKNNTSASGDGAYKPTQYVKMDASDSNDVDIDQCTFGNLEEHDDYPQPGVEDEGGGDSSMHSTIICNTEGTATSGIDSKSNNWGYNNDSDGSLGSNSTVSADNKNPKNYGLSYLPRIESGSALASAGLSGGRCGAEIMYRYGNDSDGDGVCGQLYGESGWNQVNTSRPLWPFPNEDVIKTACSKRSTRGFCASGQTLTKYIWEYLGNTMPADIYGPSSPVISTSSLPNGDIGVSYSQTLSASGGETPYSWTVISGSLPNGLSLNTSSGTIAGTPTTTQTASFTVQLTDNDYDTDTQALSITINAPDTTPPNISSIATSDIANDSFTVSWTTNEAATSQVEYGLTAGYGSQTALDSSLVTSHSVTVSGLDSDTTYHFRVKSKDNAGNEAVSSDNSVSTSDYNDYSSNDPTLVLTGSTPEEGTMTVNIPTDPASANSAELILTLYDPDNEGEGYISINGYGNIELPWGNYDSQVVTFDPIAIDTNWLAQGDNTVRFTHVATAGYEVRGLVIRLNASGGTVIVDTSPPYTSGHVPLKGAVDVSPDSSVVVKVKDDGAGVDINSIVMRVEGQVVDPVITGTPAEYTLTYTPQTPFTTGATVDVEIEASDLAD